MIGAQRGGRGGGRRGRPPQKVSEPILNDDGDQGLVSGGPQGAIGEIPGGAVKRVASVPEDGEDSQIDVGELNDAGRSGTGEDRVDPLEGGNGRGNRGELGIPRVMSNQVIQATQAIQRGERKRKLEQEEEELLRKLRRIQEEKDNLVELVATPAAFAAPPGEVGATQPAPAASGEVRLQQRDLVEAMSAAFAQALKVNAQRDTQPGLVNRLASSKEAMEFSGNSLEWLRFKRAFVTSTVSGNYTDEENVSRLYELLKGDARKAVESLMFTTKSAAEIMGALELLYGGSDRILQKLVESLRKLPRLSSGEMNVITFASHVKNNVTAIRSIGDKGYLSNPDLLYDILRKLPESMIFSYNEFIARNDRVSDLSALADHLGDQARIATLAGTARILNSVRKSDSERRDNNRPRRVYAVETRERSPVRRRDRSRSPIKRRNNSRNSGRRRELLTCFYCRANHSIDKCQDFESMSFKKRWEWAKRAKRCFKCLGTEHSSRDCRAPGCRVSGCKYQHHLLLHREPDNDPAPRKSRERERINATSD